MLTVERVKEKIDIQSLPKPAMVIDSEIILDKYQQLSNLIDGVELFYSVKTNPHDEILKLLKKAGSGFEISSLQELQELIKLGAPPDKIISGNTLKTPELIAEAYKYKVNLFSYDSKMEIDKIARYAPNACVYLRVVVDNTGSDWPLSTKFGCPTSQALELLLYAKEKELTPKGLTFHVGSQSLDPLSWSRALKTMGEVYHQAKANNICIELISLGGGFPSKLTKSIPRLDEIKVNINKTIKDVFPDGPIKYYIEPGRGLVGEAALIVSNVIAVVPRGPENWLIIDVGVFNSLIETKAGIEYEMISEKQLDGLFNTNELVPYTIGGPTCDSWDTVVTNYPLPKNLTYGDIIYILNTGAYTNCVSTRFNGFDHPRIIMI